MRLRVWVARIAAVAVAAMFTAPAYAALCWSASGTYSNLEEEVLPYSMTDKSSWYSDKDYNAYRYDGDGNPRYHRYQDVSAYGENWSFTNSIDVWRSTHIKRGGYTTASWAMWQYASGGC